MGVSKSKQFKLDIDYLEEVAIQLVSRLRPPLLFLPRKGPFGRGGIGDLRSSWLLATSYVWDDPPSSTSSARKARRGVLLLGRYSYSQGFW